MASGEIKVNRIKRAEKVQMGLLSSALAPEILASRVPRLGEVQEARREYRNKMNEIQQWAHHTRTTGWVPDGSMQYVAQIDQAVWSVILDLFARYDETTGELMDDGLLYVKNHRGDIVLNKPFFYALLEYLQSNGYECDMRGKIKLT